MSMSKYDQKVSPIKMLNSPQVKSFQTPAKFVTQRNQTIYEEEYYKQKCDRLDKQNRELKEHVRIVETQNKQLKTQIQYYRQHPQATQKSYQSKIDYQQRKDTSMVSFKDQRFMQYDEPKLQEIQRLLKQIRVLKNNYQMEINEYKTQQKRLNKKVLELEDVIHKNSLQWQSKCQNAEVSVQQKNKLLEKQIKQLRKSVVTYMQQRDQNENSLNTLKKQIQSQSQRIQQLVDRQKNLLQEKVQFQQIIRQKDVEKLSILKKNQRNAQEKQNQGQDDRKYQKIRDSVYVFGLNSRRDKIRQSNFSIHTFNGNRHVLAQQAFQVSEALKSEIYRLQRQIQNQQISHKSDLNDLNFLIQRGQREIKEKQEDLVSLLTKVKPLLLQKNRMIPKENINPDESKKANFQETKQTIGKNAFGLRMLELYLKKYKMQAF